MVFIHFYSFLTTICKSASKKWNKIIIKKKFLHLTRISTKEFRFGVVETRTIMANKKQVRKLGLNKLGLDKTRINPFNDNPIHRSDHSANYQWY